MVSPPPPQLRGGAPQKRVPIPGPLPSFSALSREHLWSGRKEPGSRHVSAPVIPGGEDFRLCRELGPSARRRRRSDAPGPWAPGARLSSAARRSLSPSRGLPLPGSASLLSSAGRTPPAPPSTVGSRVCEGPGRGGGLHGPGPASESEALQLQRVDVPRRSRMGSDELSVHAQTCHKVASFGLSACYPEVRAHGGLS